MSGASVSIRALLREGEQTLAAGPHPAKARLDAEFLLLHLLRREDSSRNRAFLIAHSNRPTSHGPEFRALVRRRLTGEPIQYMTGETEFYGLPFRVTPAVLIPRPETEGLVEKVLSLAAGFSAPRIIDVGTGSGAIPIALAAHLSQASITSIDLSAEALMVARGNAALNGVEAEIRFLEGDLLTPVLAERFEVVVSNPPYVPLEDRPAMDVEVREYEPSLALFAGEDGLSIYRRLIPQAFSVLVEGGWLAMEIGYGQREAIESLLSENGFEQIEFVADLQEIPRVVCARKRAGV
jgi:release factor glutamine methyltransferase